MIHPPITQIAQKRKSKNGGANTLLCSIFQTAQIVLRRLRWKRLGLCVPLPFLRNLRILTQRLLQHRNLAGVIEIVLNDPVQRDINRRHAFQNRLIEA